MTTLWLSQSAPPSPERSDPSPAGQVCYENIGPRQRQLRARFGLVALAFALALAGVLLAVGAHPLWRLLLFFPLASAITSWLQARERT
jgi:hypothetical protein